MYGIFLVFAVLVLTISKASETNALIDDVIEVLKLGKEIGSTLYETWDIVEQRNNGDDGVEVPFRKKREKKILNRLNEVSRKISAFEDEVRTKIPKKCFVCRIMRNGRVARISHLVVFCGVNYSFLVSPQSLSSSTWSVETISSFITTSTKVELTLHELSDLMYRIRSQYKLMRAFSKNYGDFEDITLERFAQSTISHDTMSIGGLMERIHLLVVGSDDFENLGNVGLLKLLANSFEVIKFKCKCVQQSSESQHARNS